MIKCIMHVDYGKFGVGIDKEIYDYIEYYYGDSVADHILEPGLDGKYNIIGRSINAFRFNEVLIDAFENTSGAYSSGHVVAEGEFTCDMVDGKETNGIVKFYY